MLLIILLISAAAFARHFDAAYFSHTIAVSPPILPLAHAISFSPSDFADGCAIDTPLLRCCRRF
jgi:hypothetical protein